MDDESRTNLQPALIDSEVVSATGSATSSRNPLGDRPDQNIIDGEATFADTLSQFFQSDRGHQLADKCLDLINGFKRAALEERAKAHALDGELKRLSLRQAWLLKTLGLVIVVSAIVVLSAMNTLRPEAATILGAVAGYLFAQQSKSS